MKSFLHRYAIPLILLAVTALAYGWQLTRLGFYWDDWVFVYRYQTLGIFNTIFYGGTRQLGVFALMPGFLFAGDSPLLWHIYSLLLRWGVALLFWWALNRMWTNQKTAVTLMAAVFVVHPAFSQQSISVVYSLQFVNYAIFLFSFGAMVSAERPGLACPAFFAGRRWVWLALALIGQALHLFIVEYFVGLELIRPVALYFLQKDEKRWQRIKSAFLHYLPYLLVLVVYAVWRSGVLGGGFDTYEYKTFMAFFRIDPRAAVTEAVEYGLKDILLILVNTWNSTISPSIIDLGQPYNFFSLILAVFSAFGLFFALSRLDLDADAPENNSFLAQAAILAFVAVVVSFIPSWIVRRHIVEPGNFGDRFALAGLFGASILVVVFARFFGGRSWRSILLAALFVGLAIGSQIRHANDYRWDWERQLRTYWQVYWRAPALAPGTILVGYDSISTTTVNYVGAFAFNVLYEPYPPPSMPRIWYVNYPKTTIAANLDRFRSGDWVFADEFDLYAVSVRPQNSLGIDYTDKRCVKILDADDQVNYSLDDNFRPVAGFSNLALIQPDGGSPPPQRIFGPSPTATWCYYYQKADLARQQGDWDKVISLKKEADKAGFDEPLNAYELLPFVEAYAMRADWATAQKLTTQAYKSLPKSFDGLCLVWQRVGQSKPYGYDMAYQQVSAQLGCR